MKKKKIPFILVVCSLIYVFSLVLSIWGSTIVSQPTHIFNMSKTYFHSYKPDTNMTYIYRPIITKTEYPITQSRDYLLNNVTICSNVTTISVLFIIHTAIDHFQARNNIRSTFTLRERYLPEEVRVIFLLGRSETDKFQREIIEEHKKYGDIIQGDFIDSYHNLTHKSVMGLRWGYENCRRIKYVIKLDDDLVFDTKLFFKHMYNNHLTAKKTMWCHVVRSSIYRAGKWKIEKDQFKGYKRWPWAYCPGFVVLITGDLLISLYQASLVAPFFWVDDVYTFGILPSHVGDVVFKNFPSNTKLEQSNVRAIKCLNSSKSCELLAVGAKNNVQFTNIWNLMKHSQ